MNKDTLQQEFQTDHLLGTCTKSPGCKVKIEVRVQPEASKAAWKRAIHQVGKEVSLPGFRKGRAPDTLILQNYPKAIDQEWRQVLLETAFRESLTKVQLNPVDKDQISAKVVQASSPEEEASLLFQFESEPTVPDVQPESLSLKSLQPSPVEEKDIQEVVGQIRLHYAQWEHEEDRGAQEGDWVTVDIVALEKDGKEEQIVTKERIGINDKISGWLKKLLIGLKPGSSAEGENALDENASDEVKEAFVPGKFRIILQSIDVPKLPELDDELAKKVGAASVAEMQTQIQRKLEREAEEEIRMKQAETVEKQLLAHYVFDLPSSVVEKESEFRLKQKKEALKEQGKHYSEEELREETQKETEETLRLYYLCRKYGSKHKIQVTYQEIFTRLAKLFNLTADQLQHIVKNPNMVPQEIFTSVFSRLLIEKVKIHLIENAKMVA